MTSLSPRDIEARYRFAREIARAAADLAFSFYQRRQSPAVNFKQGLQDVVSEADRRVEALIRRMISRRFPLDGFLGEESGSTGENAACVWVVDPIDGTACFLNGLHTVYRDRHGDRRRADDRRGLRSQPPRDVPRLSRPRRLSQRGTDRRACRAQRRGWRDGRRDFTARVSGGIQRLSLSPAAGGRDVCAQRLRRVDDRRWPPVGCWAITNRT